MRWFQDDALNKFTYLLNLDDESYYNFLRRLLVSELYLKILYIGQTRVFSSQLNTYIDSGRVMLLI